MIGARRLMMTSVNPYPLFFGFESGITGWSGVGSAVIAASTTVAHEGTTSLRFTTAAVWSGAEYTLPVSIPRAGNTIVVEGWGYRASGGSNYGWTLFDDSYNGCGSIITTAGATQYAAEYDTRTAYTAFTSGSASPSVGTGWYRHRLTITPTNIKNEVYTAAGALIATINHASSTDITFTKFYIRSDQTNNYFDEITISVTPI